MANDITYEQAMKLFKLKPDYGYNELTSAYQEILNKRKLDTATATIALEILNEHLMERQNKVNGSNDCAQANAHEASEHFRSHRRQKGTSRAEYLNSELMDNVEFLETPASDDDPVGYRVLRGIAQHFPYRLVFLLIGIALWAEPWGITNLVLPIAWLNLIFPIITDKIREMLIKATYVSLDVFEALEDAAATAKSNEKNIAKSDK